MRQLITPNPNIPCAPGWCLQYVRQTFGLPARYGSATEAWEKSESQHRDRNFPDGVWIPVWYGLDTTPLGHVVLMAPDRSVYSTSDLGSTPHHHPDLADLEAYYAYYGMDLSYRGWTEDVAGYPVIGDSITTQSTTTKPKRMFQHMNAEEEAEVLKAARAINRYLDAPISKVPKALLDAPIRRAVVGGDTSLRSTIAWLDTNLDTIEKGHSGA